MNPLIVIRGGGDLASGTALRLHRAGFSVVILELDQPMAVRRGVAFSEAVYEGTHTVEGTISRLVSPDQLMVSLEAGEIPVVIDPNARILSNQFLTSPNNTFLVDARLMKTAPEALDVKLPLHVGLGPGFTAGENCTAVVETRRGHTLGRVYWEGTSLPDSGQPDGDPNRVLRAGSDGTLTTHVEIGDPLQKEQLIGEINASVGDGKEQIVSPFAGVMRGLLRNGFEVTAGMKLGDVDARNDRSACFTVSDKALAVGGGVVEAVMVKLRQIES
jgi:xanthine dehydrogenase accessory factor